MYGESAIPREKPPNKYSTPKAYLLVLIERQSSNDARLEDLLQQGTFKVTQVSLEVCR